MFYYPLSSLLIECLILSIVEREDSYGYEISQTVKLVANIKESTLYPILRKLEQNGYLHTYSQEFQGQDILLLLNGYPVPFYIFYFPSGIILPSMMSSIV